jgi:lipopolysaccharide transport system ATP-binding protein
MVENVIEVSNLSKLYRLGEIGTGTLSRDLHRMVARMMGKPDPFLKVGQLNDRAVKGKGDIVYSLQDIDFSIGQGEAVAIIGKNGSGKSTLLKLLSRVTHPTTGEIRVKGRIASLLEVGTGFHPELTGRENIYLNGAILGMRKREIRRRFDEIVDYSEVERYIDTPVKRYSSGMYVRLAFAVAAHLESEILIVDEVLAVGDADFQNKCLGKMKNVSTQQGRTVIFVSHNMASVKSLCRTGLLLDKGRIIEHGAIDHVINRYLNSAARNPAYDAITNDMHIIATGEAYFRSLAVKSIHTEQLNAIPFDGPLSISFTFECVTSVKNMFFDIKIMSREGVEISLSQSNWSAYGYHSFEPGTYSMKAEIENRLQPGLYFLTLGAHKADGTTYAYLENIISFEVLSISFGGGEGYNQSWTHGYFRPATDWSLE